MNECVIDFSALSPPLWDIRSEIIHTLGAFVVITWPSISSPSSQISLCGTLRPRAQNPAWISLLRVIRRSRCRFHHPAWPSMTLLFSYSACDQFFGLFFNILTVIIWCRLSTPFASDRWDGNGKSVWNATKRAYRAVQIPTFQHRRRVEVLRRESHMRNVSLAVFFSTHTHTHTVQMYGHYGTNVPRCVTSALFHVLQNE